MKRYVTFILIASLMLVGTIAVSAQSGGGYDLSWSTVDGGGHTWSEGGGYSLGGTIGQPDAGATIIGGGYSLQGGFWQVIPSSGPQDPICVTHDLNFDGFIDLDDINLVLFNSIFSRSTVRRPLRSHPDGVVDIADVFDVAIYFGYQCP